MLSETGTLMLAGLSFLQVLVFGTIALKNFAVGLLKGKFVFFPNPFNQTKIILRRLLYDVVSSKTQLLTKLHAATDLKYEAIANELDKNEKLVFSILMPVYNVDSAYLREAVASIMAQTYSHWELCLVDDCSTGTETVREIQIVASLDARIRLKTRASNGHISGATNDALAMATGEFCILMGNDDLLHKQALTAVAHYIKSNQGVKLVYSDEDKVNQNGLFYEPFLKPEFSLELLYSINYLNHMCVIDTAIMKSIGGFRTGFEGSQDYDLYLRAIEKLNPNQIGHIPELLYHWRAIPGSVFLATGEKNHSTAAARRAIQEHLDRMGGGARVLPGYLFFHRVEYSLPQWLPTITVIIATKNRLDLLRPLLEGLLFKTNYYSGLEIIIIDNNSDEPETLAYLKSIQSWSNIRVIQHSAPFNFSEIYNKGVYEAKGEFACLLNNDMRVIDPDWLIEMLRFALRPTVGLVGAKLLYPNGTIQHAGVLTGVCDGVAAHPFCGFPNSDPGYFGFPHISREVAAVTGACMLIRRAFFLDIKGFDADNLAIAYNDVDLCLKVRDKGKKVIYCATACLQHLESQSRGLDAVDPSKRERQKKEGNFLKAKWTSRLEDPYYHPRLSKMYLYSL